MTEVKGEKLAYVRPRLDFTIDAYRNGSFADCQIVCKGQRRKDGTGMVSSMIMCAVSPLLRRIMPPPGDEHEDTVILLPDWTLEMVDKAWKYICTGVVRSSDSSNHDVAGSLTSLLEIFLGKMSTHDHIILEMPREMPDSESDEDGDADDSDPTSGHPSDEATDGHPNDGATDGQTSKAIKSQHPAASDIPTCDVCAKTFKMNFYLNRHKKTAHQENIPKEPSPLDTGGATNDVQIERDESRSLFDYFEDNNWRKCPICVPEEILNPEIFQKIEFFVAHLFSSHLPFAEIVNTEEPDSQVYICDNSKWCPQFEDKKQFIKHKYGGCKHDKTVKSCGLNLKCSSQLIYMLKKITLGKIICRQKILQGKIKPTAETENIDLPSEEINLEDIGSSRRLSQDFSLSTCTTIRTQSAAASSDSGDSDPVKCSFCKTVFKSQRRHDRAVKHECINQPPEVVIEEDSKPDANKKNSHGCYVCIGTLRPVLKDNINLMRHYLLGHYQDFFKRNKKNTFRIEKFPWTCSYCIKENKPNPTELPNWEEVILHLGVNHEKLYWALKRDREFEMRNVQKFLFPDLDKKQRAKSRTPVKRTPEKRRNSETSTGKHSNPEIQNLEKRINSVKPTEKRSNPEIQNPTTSLFTSISPPKGRKSETRKTATEVSSPAASDVEDEPVFKKDKRSFRESISDEESENSEKGSKKLKQGRDKERVSQTNWEQEMNKAGTAEVSPSEDQIKKQKDGVECRECDVTFPTRAIMRLHTCESLLDQRDLCESPAGSRKARRDVENNSSSRNKKFKKMAEVKTLQKYKDTEIILEPVHNMDDQIDLQLEPVTKSDSDEDESEDQAKGERGKETNSSKSSSVSNKEDQAKGEREKGSNSSKMSSVSNQEDQAKGGKEKGSNSSHSKSAIARCSVDSVDSNGGRNESTDELKCDNCLLVLPNQKSKRKHMKCKHCRKRCVDLETHIYCPVHQTCYPEGEHFFCDVCEEECYKTESEREKHKAGHTWDDYG